MLEVIDEDQLISFLGGTREVELDDDWGPWNDYEVVDGVKKNDVVGIRHKTTGQLFTITDYELLPNYIIGEDFEVPEVDQAKLQIPLQNEDDASVQDIDGDGEQTALQSPI